MSEELNTIVTPDGVDLASGEDTTAEIVVEAPVETAVESVESVEKEITKVVEDPSSDGFNTPSEVRISELDAKEQVTPDFANGAKVCNGEEEITIFTKEADGADFLKKAQLFAEAHGYEVK